MLGITLPLLLLLMYFLSTKEDISQVSLIWSVIFLYDMTIGRLLYSEEGYFLFYCLIDIFLAVTLVLIRDRCKQMLMFIVIFISFSLNLQEHLSFYQTWAYDILKTYQWLSVELLVFLLLWNENDVQIRRNNY